MFAPKKAESAVGKRGGSFDDVATVGAGLSEQLAGIATGEPKGFRGALRISCDG
jgi:hypothetical protein